MVKIKFYNLYRLVYCLLLLLFQAICKFYFRFLLLFFYYVILCVIMSLEIPIAIISAFFVGTSDFLSRMRPPYRHVVNSLLGMSVFGGLLCALYALYHHQDVFFFKDYKTLSLIALSGISNIIALLFLYVGFDKGPISVVAPITTLSAVFLAIKWFFLGITLSFYGYLGGLVSVLGAMILGLKFKTDIYSTKHILVAVALGLISAFFFSLRLFLMQFIAYDIDYSIILTQTRFFGFLFTLIIITYYLFVKKQNILPTVQDFCLKGDVIYPFLQALTGVIGLILLLIVSSGEYTVIAPTIFSINAAFAVLWSVFIFKEKITFQRVIAFFIMIAGISILKISD